MPIPESLLNELLDDILTLKQDSELLKSIVFDDPFFNSFFYKISCSFLQ